MSIAPDLNAARRKQLLLSVVVTSLIAALAAAVTFAMALRDDLSLIARIAISAVIWIWCLGRHGNFERYTYAWGLTLKARASTPNSALLTDAKLPPNELTLRANSSEVCCGKSRSASCPCRCSWRRNEKWTRDDVAF